MTLRNVNPRRPCFCGRSSDSDSGTQPTLIYSRSPYSRMKLKMMPLARGSAQPFAALHPRVARRLIEDRVEQELALLEPPARQPLDLQVEFRAEAAQQVLRLRLVPLEE